MCVDSWAHFTLSGGKGNRNSVKKKAAIGKGAANWFRAFCLRANCSARAWRAADGCRKVLLAMSLLMLTPPFTQHQRGVLAKGHGLAQSLPRRRGPVRPQMAGR